jgi:hypothetical protein
MADEYRIDIGGVVIGVGCPQSGLAEGLERWFGRPSAPAAPHLHLDLEIVPHDDEPALPQSLLTTKRLDGDGRFDIADGLLRGRYDRAARRGEIQAKQVLTTGRLPRILEQIFYQAFHSARGAAGVDAWLVHSSAVIVDGRGYLFVGPSEAGKSTVARLSADHHVLGDEMNVLLPTDDGIDVAGTVFNGTFRDKAPGRAPLAGIFLLQQAPHHRVSDARDAADISAFAGEIVPPVGLDELPDRGTLPAMVDAAAMAAGKSALKRLEFLPDAGFWKVILND